MAPRSWGYFFYNLFNVRLDRNGHTEIYYSNHIFPYLSCPFRSANFFLLFDQNPSKFNLLEIGHTILLYNITVKANNNKQRSHKD